MKWREEAPGLHVASAEAFHLEVYREARDTFVVHVLIGEGACTASAKSLDAAKKLAERLFRALDEAL